MNNNQIILIPLTIINLKKLEYFYYNDNPLENLLNPIINRFINKIKKNNIINIYNDTQNVHSSSIQQSIKESIYNLMSKIKEPLNYNYLDDIILTKQTKEILIEYSNDKTIHSILECTFNEILDSVFLEINTFNETIQKEIKKRINEEMEDGLCKCFTGRISRLVNSLSGYSDLVSIKISPSEEIGNIISNIKLKYNDILKVKLNVSLELKLRGYKQNVIDEWLEYID
jgi:hypothetical protein